MEIPLQQYKYEDGATAAYRIYGVENTLNTPMVLVMGLSGTMEDWTPFVDEVSKDRAVLVFDNRGIGESFLPDGTPSDAPLTIDMMADDTIALAKHLKWTRIILAGWSMGGMISLTVMRKILGDKSYNGLQVEKLVLCATCMEEPNGSELSKAFEDNFGPGGKFRGRKLTGEEQMEWIMTIFKMNYSEGWTEANEDKFNERIAQAASSRRPAKLIAAQSKAVSKYNVVKETEANAKRFPSTLIIHGTADRIVPLKFGEAIYDALKRGGASHVDWAQFDNNAYGHWFYDEVKASKLINEWVSDISEGNAKL